MVKLVNNLFLYQRLGTNSKRAIERVYGKFGRRYYYYPRSRLVKRLAAQLDWSEQSVIDQLLHERAILVKEYLSSMK